MPSEIILTRHAQTMANKTRVWQGSTNSRFSPEGMAQLKRLAARFDGNPFDMVISSDLGRAVGTAGAFGLDFETDARWREPNVGEWEGLTYEEIRQRDPDRIARLIAGRDVELGGGERLLAVADRLQDAYADLASRLDGAGRALVVSHGLAIVVLLSALLATKRPSPFQLPANTGVSVLRSGEFGTQLYRYNDATHVDEDAGRREKGETHVVLIRHGQTVANVEGRWQGQTDGVLTDLGRDQAQRVGPFLPRLDALYASPLGRARDTATAIARATGAPPDDLDGVMEIGFGAWESKTSEEIAEIDADGLHRLRDLGEDFPRGGTGETFVGARSRITGAIEGLVAKHPGQTVGVVTHGGVSRAYLTGLLGIGYAARYGIGLLGNTAFARIVYGSRGPRIASWNLAPHLLD